YSFLCYCILLLLLFSLPLLSTLFPYTTLFRSLLAVSIFSALTFTLSTPESFAECSGSEVTTVEGGSDNSDLGASASKKSRCSASTDDRSAITPSRIVSNIQYITRTVESGVGDNCISDGSGGETCVTHENS